MKDQKKGRSRKRDHLKKKEGTTIPKEYPWKVLSALIKDAEKISLLPADRVIINTLRGIVRRRSVDEYISFCEHHSLTTVNRDETLLDLYCDDEATVINSIRIRRIFTIFQKYAFENSPFDQEATALKSFFASEEGCRRTNADSTLSRFNDSKAKSTAIEDLLLFPVFREAASFIKRVIGTGDDISAIFAESCHGPGATSLRAGNDSLPLRKYSYPIDVTSGASDFFLYYLYQEDRWLRSLVQHFNYEAEKDSTQLATSQSWHDVFIKKILKPTEVSRIMFVPKDARKHRTICAEPTANVFLQLGIDRYIRRRLCYYGIDLSTQEKNQNLAQRGAQSNLLTTLDLSAASDSIALKILELFPPQWANILKSLRTPAGIIKDKKIVFEKLSSMGNGFTFVIETLIFSALLYGVIKCKGDEWDHVIDRVAVYGDDIICPTKYTSDLIYVLKRCGFSVNYGKSFTNGPVRESCGKDFYKYHEISRPTIKSQPRVDWELTRDYNRIYRLSKNYDIDLSDTLHLLLSWHKTKNFGPICEDEVGWLFSELPSSFPTSYHKDAIDWQTPVFRLKKFVVTRPTGKKYSSDKFYFPLMFLRKSRGSCWDESPDFNIRTPLNLRAEALTFSKLECKVKVTMVSMPFYIWHEKAADRVYVWA